MFNPWVGKVPWRRKWQPLQYSCLENPMDRGAWWATTESDTTWQLNTYPGGQAQVLLSELNKGTPIYSQAEEQGPLRQAVMHDYNDKSNNKKASQRNSFQYRVRVGFFSATELQTAIIF